MGGDVFEPDFVSIPIPLPIGCASRERVNAKFECIGEAKIKLRGKPENVVRGLSAVVFGGGFARENIIVVNVNACVTSLFFVIRVDLYFLRGGVG